MQFGSSESLTCIEPVQFSGPSGEDLCLAYKLSTMHIGLPAYITDDGYVLKVVGADEYLELPSELVAELQSDGSLSSPLPSYSISTTQYVFGYSLWLAVVAGLLIGGVSIWQLWRRNKRQRSVAFFQASRRAGDAAITLVEKSATRDPNTDAEAGCLLLTDKELIYSGGSGDELAIARELITDIDTTPIIGTVTRTAGEQLRISYSDDEGSQVLRIQVRQQESWLKELGGQEAST